MSPAALAYLAGSGTVNNNSVVRRGLFRAIRHLVEGDYREAGVETLAAMAAPALMGYASTASFVWPWSTARMNWPGRKWRRAISVDSTNVTRRILWPRVQAITGRLWSFGRFFFSYGERTNEILNDWLSRIRRENHM
jgi:hypothetical protein